MQHALAKLAAGCAAAGCAAAACAMIASPAHAQQRDDSRLGALSLGVATASAPGDTILYDGALGVRYHAPVLDLGLSMGGASAPLISGDRTAVNLVPEVGAHIGWRSRDRGALFHLFSAARLPLQSRSGAGLPASFGIAASAEAGARLWSCSVRSQSLSGLCYGLGLSARYQVHLSDFQLGPAVLPAGSSVLSFPVTIDVGANFDL